MWQSCGTRGVARTPWTASDSQVLCSHSQPPQQCLLAPPSPPTQLVLPLAARCWEQGQTCCQDTWLWGRRAAQPAPQGELSVQPAPRSLTRQQSTLHCSPLPTAVNRHKPGAFKGTDLSPYSSEGQTFKISPSELKARWWKGCVRLEALGRLCFLSFCSF